MSTPEPLPSHCGYPWPKGGYHAGCGCGEAFETWRDVFRCTDCGVAMHRRCLIMHFGDGRERDIPGQGLVRSPTHTAHHFAFQVAWAVKQVTDRDAEIRRLQAILEERQND
jgi:hypothetical protein